jgi:hypothetical protein
MVSKPSFASLTATAEPIPLAEPVTKATRFALPIFAYLYSYSCVLQRGLKSLHSVFTKVKLPFLPRTTKSMTINANR